MNKLSKRNEYEHLVHALVPYIAVVIGLYCFRNAWLDLLLYHLQIILCACFYKTDIKNILFKGFSVKHFLIFVAPLLFFGLLLYLLFPYILKEGVSLNGWLCSYRMDDKSFIPLIPYFCIIHPVLEEIHWGKFRGYEKNNGIMCLLFAGYHVMVLVKLLSFPWLILSFIVLVVVAYIWAILYKRLEGGIIPFLSHVVADIGIIGATYFFAFNN